MTPVIPLISLEQFKKKFEHDLNEFIDDAKIDETREYLYNIESINNIYISFKKNNILVNLDKSGTQFRSCILHLEPVETPIWMIITNIFDNFPFEKQKKIARIEHFKIETSKPQVCFLNFYCRGNEDDSLKSQGRSRSQPILSLNHFLKSKLSTDDLHEGIEGSIETHSKSLPTYSFTHFFNSKRKKTN